MTRFRELIESINDAKQWLSQGSSFINRLKKGCGITDDINKGGLILPDGTLINCFPDSHLMHYDSLPFIYPDKITSKEYGNFKEQDDFDNEVIDNNIIRYSINHSIQEAYIKLPNLNITKPQIDKLQEILFSLKPEQKIPVMVENDLYKVAYATNTSNARDVIKELSTNNLAEGDKKVFDKDSGYNSSYDEQYYFELLKKKWPDVQISYTDDRFINPETNRHFQLDFYVPSLDMGINLMKDWTHGRRPYNPKDPDCQADVAWLKSKDGDFYDRALKQWTITDPIKRQVAKDNGLKYVEIFNMDEFLKWYNNPKLTYEEYKYPTRLKYDSDEYFKQKARGRDIYGLDSRPYAD